MNAIPNHAESASLLFRALAVVERILGGTATIFPLKDVRLICWEVVSPVGWKVQVTAEDVVYDHISPTLRIEVSVWAVELLAQLQRHVSTVKASFLKDTWYMHDDEISFEALTRYLTDIGAGRPRLPMTFEP